MSPGHSRDRIAEGAAWALTFLVTLSSVVFAAAAVVGWRINLWPATPVTLAIAALAVLGGPVLAALLTRAIRRSAAPTSAPPPARRPRATHAAPPAVPARAARRSAAPAPAPAPAPLVLSPEAARARELLDWRRRPWRRRP